MAAKRPSYVSIRARQRNIIEGIGTKQLTIKQAATELGVTQSELRRFVETKPKELRRSYNRSPGVRKLYESGERAQVRKSLSVGRIYRYDYRERVLRDTRIITTQTRPNPVQVGRMVQRLYYENNIASQRWSEYTYDKGLPNSIYAIRLLFRNDRISGREYGRILSVWRQTYGNISDLYYSKFADELDEDDTAGE